ncbi:hypothetical protein LAV_00220 [Sphingobium phage Lacusarx]|uniref:Uncharacterized protein n=1 Tax=Sphingobium phage Lacusarx TaxID=1980139 RepID=A0A1W6DXG6_9CAUD|nr:hypothetical protein FDH44_gp083 [Sphingobium phage Lacusarx]ARK07595.1 hypothetical protein LAV_00220 [Sphingobium phage Lacusarx]
MRNSMPLFTVLKNKVVVGQVSAVSLEQAKGRAYGRFGRCEVIANGNVPMDAKGRHADCFTHGRRPYATPGFEERRAALIAEFKAAQ